MQIKQFASITALTLLSGTSLCLASAQQSLTRASIAPPAQVSGQTATGQSGSGQAAPSGSLGVVDAKTYQLSPQDNIEVSVYKEPSVSGTFPIRPDGMISLPLTGDISAAGQTPMQLANSIADRLKKFMQDPNVTVTVLAVQPKEVFVLGEIMRVGPVILVPGMSPLQAISSAGGLSPYANAKRVYILRTVDGKQTKLPFDYKKALKLGDQQGVTLLPGDTIVIP